MRCGDPRHLSVHEQAYCSSWPGRYRPAAPVSVARNYQGEPRCDRLLHGWRRGCPCQTTACARDMVLDAGRQTPGPMGPCHTHARRPANQMTNEKMKKGGSIMDLL